jgi:hypothetical protein
MVVTLSLHDDRPGSRATIPRDHQEIIPVPEPAEREADKFCRENIEITGLELGMSKVNAINLPDIYERIGRNDKPFIITIPSDAPSIESAIDYWPILCLTSVANISKVAARATLERHPPTETGNRHPRDLADKEGAEQIPFPNKPDAPDNFYHRWWRWPTSPAWREPGVYLLKIRLGYNRFAMAPSPPTPKSDADWISVPITYTIEIRQKKPAKTKGK